MAAKRVYKWSFEDYKNGTLSKSQEKEFVKQFEPLVFKITKQFTSRVKIEWERVLSMAWEGFSLALVKYDPSRSSMSFVQYAGFSIRNNILSSLDNELRTVKLSAYAQARVSEKYGSKGLFNTVSIDAPARRGDSDSDQESRPVHRNLLDRPVQEKFSDGDTFEYIYQRLEERFRPRDCDMFYKAFGLKDFDEKRGKEIAQEYGVSEGLVSQKVNKIIRYMRQDSDICDMLARMLDQ